MAPSGGARGRAGSGGGVVLGEDWDRPEGTEAELASARERRGLLSLDRSPLARKIILFNLLAILLLVAGVLFLNPTQESLVMQREKGLVTEARLVSDILEASLPAGVPVSFGAGDGVDVPDLLSRIDIARGIEVHVFDTQGALVAQAVGNTGVGAVRGLDDQVQQTTVITSALNALWEGVTAVFAPSEDQAPRPLAVARDLVATAIPGETQISGYRGEEGLLYTVTTPIMVGERMLGTIAVTTPAGEIDALVRAEREQLLQMFMIALMVSIILSLLLAATIANPLSDLAAAAELGRDKHARKMSPQRVRIPDLTARPDEIGRLSGALRGMISALYDRIESNEQFAADVAHEIKNPLASLRSAVGTMALAKTDEQRSRLLEVIEHDVRRLDRLVSDISNASRLDSELVKEEEEPFDLVKMLNNLTVYHAQEAEMQGIDFITDLPKEPIIIMGLEARLAQVFVNLITNALSFCEEGDAVRVWLRRRDNRVLVVVEDTGPGIPDAALTKVFNRFYSERPMSDFGNHSGLGLAISKQIVEAHGGVIWAENIRPTELDVTSEPLGARFVVGLPV
ncbi:sensor N-terminal transmembrane domain-containing protein [Jannaschia seohaensis]|uniref:histidine kinase n=1 Tax=Jannaschia seohaensis TaxID=475081 RepID=A0A2Y9AA14_9RHOB|nr:sensor N-terminal transmembrane domain-containing protein [Jannaschia seohaensis]PWJ20971.1 two-component system sensor histidine kinase ChvG [Jannaschia seohaensis]SSA41381.1 two-component system, OmpR family, sensor histidine kinase ChvG [Jannaschia seohaensis]